MMQIEIAEKINEFEKEMRGLQMQIDLLDHKLNTLKHKVEDFKESVKVVGPLKPDVME